MTQRFPAFTVALLALATCVPMGHAADGRTPDFNEDVAPILRKYCNGCHNDTDAESGLSLESFERLNKGGDNGRILEPGRSGKSRMIQMLEKKLEPVMPPEDSPAPSAAEIAVLRSWIDAGAAPSADESRPAALETPLVPTVGTVRVPVHALAHAPDGKLLAVARHGQVELRTAADQEPARVLAGLAGHVHALGFSSDGSLLYAAAGEPGLAGEVVLWNTSDWSVRARLAGHRDNICSAALSRDGRLLATGSYDQQIKVWDVAEGTELRTLEGHNDAVFALAFDPSGRILASASGDRTVKLWDATTGQRLDTFTEPTKEQYALDFSPDGRMVAAGGADNRIRVWQISRTAAENTNPILYTRFAHEAPILELAFSPDGERLVSAAEDREVKVWEAAEFTQLEVLETQPDWPSALAVSPENNAVVVGRLDGSLARYPLSARVAPVRLEPAAAAPAAVASAEGASADSGSKNELAETTESEPNDESTSATPLALPGRARGVIVAETEGEDADLYRIEARKGETWIIETRAARDKSPLDTRIDVLHTDGTPVLRLLMRAERASWINFRPIDSSFLDPRVEHWEEMGLNQYLYMSGEIGKIFRMPQGPDSGFRLYSDLAGKKRLCYFDTSATTHALNEPVYIVEPFPPGTELPDNGLPVFPLYYSNDDDGDRELDADSRLTFTAPADGSYLVRVSDVRGFQGDDFRYELTVRRPEPDISVTVEGRTAKIGRGSGQRFRLKLDRIDNFDDAVRVDISGVPEGFVVSSPIVIEAGHLEAQGTLFALADAEDPGKEAWEAVQIDASAQIAGRTVVKAIENLGVVKLMEKPKLLVRLEPDGPQPEAPAGELVIAPGTTITAAVIIERNGFEGEMKFDVDNLPHGVIVDNIGLSGIWIGEGEEHRQIFLTAADWVPESTRQIHAVTKGEGNQASPPLTLHVRRPASVADATVADRP